MGNITGDPYALKRRNCTYLDACIHKSGIRIVETLVLDNINTEIEQFNSENNMVWGALAKVTGINEEIKKAGSECVNSYGCSKFQTFISQGKNIMSNKIRECICVKIPAVKSTLCAKDD